MLKLTHFCATAAIMTAAVFSGPASASSQIDEGLRFDCLPTAENTAADEGLRFDCTPAAENTTVNEGLRFDC